MVIFMKKILLPHRRTWQRIGAFFVMLLCIFLTSCAGSVPEVPFLWQAGSEKAFSAKAVYTSRVEGFSPEIEYFTSSICFPQKEDLERGSQKKEISVNAAILFNISENKVLFAKNCYDSIYPASTTKLLTALAALKYSRLSDIVEIKQDNGGITVYGAKLCGFKKGDKVTMETLLNSLLVYSGNDAAVAIAEHISGSVEAFMELLNKEAACIGATHTHFTNPHGLHNAKHSTTAYDMYLIFKECLKYDAFLPIIGQASYQAEYESAVAAPQGDPIKQIKFFESTNLYLAELAEAPDGVTVYGGKTGSTGAAGDCLVLLSSYNGIYYISAVFGASSRDVLYQQMNMLLEMELSENNAD